MAAVVDAALLWKRRFVDEGRSAALRACYSSARDSSNVPDCLALATFNTRSPHCRPLITAAAAAPSESTDATTASWKREARSTYRHLLRAVTPATHFSRPAAKNLKRLLQTEYKGAIASQVPSGAANPDELAHHGASRIYACMIPSDPGSSLTCDLFRTVASRTVQFLLSAAHSPPFSDAQMRAWKVKYRRPRSVEAAFESGRSLRSIKAVQKRQRRELLRRAATAADAGGSSGKGAYVDAATALRKSRKDRARGRAASFASLFPQGNRTLAHAVTTNLASLTYHHLSPNTRMQPLWRTHGGTDSSTVPRLTQQSIRAAGFAGAHELAGDGDAGEHDAGMYIADAVPRQHTLSLIVPPKPILGPRQPAGAQHKRWDGQRVAQTFAPLASAGDPDSDAARLLHRSEELRQRYEAVAAQQHGHGGAESAAAQSAKREWKEMRGRWKSAVKTTQRERAEREREARPVRALAKLVRDAQQGSGVWLGARRFGMKEQGKWLIP
ncbi:hypothetical protein K437DRAFT_257979 [Tilletiaria anomala UBC 951]|uniref:Uncharacterized protein n=1 Tax=Tilletiaria anomala (strain ATCC 24038 / CBS 436.72 / UBC 951) TaxID=1037660 RepID=A0A066VKD4_TILAU|nr:uncharacterized protein K437DRAFT_257979 [Tilletiaria anomala UBC 951]KDN42202.1 hypothetical protein K437DRAFT_257979 [Tilletiaria anomala UBC 951]